MVNYLNQKRFKYRSLELFSLVLFILIKLMIDLFDSE